MAAALVISVVSSLWRLEMVARKEGETPTDLEIPADNKAEAHNPAYFLET